jgi:putative Mg2+ transporter-C (MgtC) family protein
MVDVSQLLDAGLKLAVAVALSAPLGLERERKERPAGLRTHVLVCVGATLLMVVSGFLTDEVGAEGAMVDKARIAAGIITGIGFLGAGTIFTIGSDQMGLTTAAMIWFMAALGITVGAGYIAVAALAAAVVLVVVMSLEVVERLLPAKLRPYRLRMQMPDGLDALEGLQQLVARRGYRADIVRVTLEERGAKAEVVFRIVARGGTEIADLARTITQHYERVEKITVER